MAAKSATEGSQPLGTICWFGCLCQPRRQLSSTFLVESSGAEEVDITLSAAAVGDAAHCDAWNRKGNWTSTLPPAGAGKRQCEIWLLIQLETSGSFMLSWSTSTPVTVPAGVIVQRMAIFPLRLGFRFKARS